MVAVEVPMAGGDGVALGDGGLFPVTARAWTKEKSLAPWDPERGGR